MSFEDDERPLSPHLQVYRPQLTSMLSAFHRIAGVAMVLSSPLLMYWLGAAAYGPDVFGAAQAVFSHWFGIMVLMGVSYAVAYHLCTGIRHLVWDLGYCLSIKDVYSSGYAAVVMSLVLWAGFWVLVFLK